MITEEEIWEAAKEFLMNPYWKRYYDDAPSEYSKRYALLSFFWSETDDEEKINRIINVDIIGYNTSNNQYVFPCDGYVTLNSNTDTAGSIDLYIYDKSGGLTMARNSLTITAESQVTALFVKKGTQGRIVKNNINTATARFVGMS